MAPLSSLRRLLLPAVSHKHDPLPYLAPLDGIRAIAIVGVVLFHVSPRVLSGGFTGVDVFFVLSGFLITSSILRDLRAGVFSLREFYVRRIQRLLPNMIVTVMAVLLLWSLFMPPSMVRQAGSHALWTLFSASNFYVLGNLGGYWGNAAEWAPLTHTWSLGIEEQFYLLFPGVLVLLVRFRPGRVGVLLLIAAALSFGVCLYGTHVHPIATFYLLPTRVWELLLGAVLAANGETLQGRPADLRPALGPRMKEVFGWVGLCLIILGYLSIADGGAFPGSVSLAPTMGTALLIVSVADGQTRMSRWLSSRSLVGIGKLSYSLYLWHWPLITFGKLQADFFVFPRLAGAIAGCLGGVLLGSAAYVFVEQPLRKRGPGRWRRLAVIAGAFFIGVLVSCHVANQVRVADPANLFDAPTFHGKLFDAGRGAGVNMEASVSYYDVQFPSLPTEPHDSWRTGGIMHHHGGSRPRVVVLGSSHALMYSRLIDDLCREMGVSVAFLGVDGSAPAFFETTVNSNFPSLRAAREFDDARRRWLREWRPEAVFVIDRWDLRVGTSPPFHISLQSFLDEVSPLAGRIIFVAQVPVVKGGEAVNLREFVASQMGAGNGLPRLEPDSNQQRRTYAVHAAEKAAKEFPNLRILRADTPFHQADGSIKYASGRSFYYADDDHLTDAGSEVVRALFREAIADALAAAPPP